MSKVQSFQEDLVELAQEKLAKRQISRRQFNVAMGLLGMGATGMALPKDAAAQAKEIVYVNWGGTANIAYGNYFGKTFEAKNPGTKVVMAPESPTAGKIRAMVDSKKVTWDVCDGSAFFAISLGGAGLLEKIDYNVVNKNLLVPGMAYEHGVAPFTFSNVMIYDSSKVGNDPPKTWADFFNFQKYPGKRMLRRDANCMFESLLMGDGVAPDKVYPIDVKRAIDMLRKHRREFVYWGSGAESEQIMRSGEAVMGVLWNSRAKVLLEETKGRLNFTWNQGILQPGVQVVPKGNPAGALVHRFLAHCVADENAQLGLFGFFGLGPANKAAAARVSPDLKRFNPTDPDNAKVQVVYDGEWWGKNYTAVNQQFLDAIAG